MSKNPATLAALRINNPPATLREIALERMRRAIISGLFEPGERLVERTLCDQLGVSRSVVREVIRHLEAEGLVEMLAKQGPIVARLEWNDARQIYDVRAALESRAVADCARLADASVKARLRKALDELDRTSQQNSPPGILDATTEFYSIIFETSGHSIAWDIVSRLNSRISRLRVMTLSTANRMTSGPSQIREIFAAIDANDPESAAAACRAHVDAAAAIARTILA
ncbi:GntR family transcriptional regulator [Sinorhizobium meliloti]|uniref:GntR family transcriptional regulator n=1 Tax=Rhizobium meliloti TaxID=382 RepID=UPI000FD9D998|nr:GntR family transcriptional regulator [Sinorhizobium meliloti]MDE3823010.1 GntR family transcriptional regulator [Sinorhizobium meliloti]RVM41537.1 GntR family transcriptional regulator [Sinorhizobium meliloti]RVN59160.1 GntR family transcriptional regulator [Sinorhizobium meliloti]RVO29092.1 GntR family transcriptional regulator [Sinorhizobium meliloti]RVP53782.1 GntR family transcriptional regulator [Sinorhizobium meliloti]